MPLIPLLEEACAAVFGFLVMSLLSCWVRLAVLLAAPLEELAAAAGSACCCLLLDGRISASTLHETDAER
jgi:hypothetical protein